LSCNAARSSIAPLHIAGIERIQLMRLGVCYYPEHWPEEMWAGDAARMVDIGLSRVRIGEFAWSRIEPSPGEFDWGWLDRAVETLHAAGLGIIMGTPTATPPKWLCDQMPDMVAIDAQGRPRKFGSRRHYCFSHIGYRAEAARITQAIADRYGAHPGVIAWQTDNEFGCHDTVVSFSDSAASGFRIWLAAKYGTVAALNRAWGNVFWSMEYRDFDEIDPPNLTVTEANPAHWLDYRRFSSDQVVSFNKAQADILRAHSPGRDIVHNFMGFYTEFDHHAVGRDLDVASWDSYPLGFLEQFWFSEDEKLAYMRQGHPDIAAFHHDLYRGCNANRRWWVMEQQPGPVNWARHNPAPLAGMVRLWTLEAMAHGAELVSYFRWRQFPQAQEQMHAGLNRPDNVEDAGAKEARIAAQDITAIGSLGPPPKAVALVFDYQSDWVTDLQPQGAGFKALRIAFEWYSALRGLGLDVDIVLPDAALEAYPMVVVPCLPILPQGFAEKLAAYPGGVLIGPRTGSKTEDFAIPASLPPGDLQALIPVKVTRVESLREGVELRGRGLKATRWLEHIESELLPKAELHDRTGILYRQNLVRYLAAHLNYDGLRFVMGEMARQAGLDPLRLPEGIRLRRAGGHRFAFNYAAHEQALPVDGITNFALGGAMLGPAGVAVWRES
jgi:beta-galactosidase